MPDKAIFDEFLEWLNEVQEKRMAEGDEVTVYDLLTIVKSLVPQLRTALTPSEVSLAFAHAAAYMERWLVENEFKVVSMENGEPVRLETAEERRYGKNALADVEDGWVPDELPEWLTSDGD